MVNAHNSILHTLVKKFLSLASSFNKEKLLTTAASTNEKGKAGADAQAGNGWLFFVKKICLLKIVGFLEDAF